MVILEDTSCDCLNPTRYLFHTNYKLFKQYHSTKYSDENCKNIGGIFVGIAFKYCMSHVFLRNSSSYGLFRSMVTKKQQQNRTKTKIKQTKNLWAMVCRYMWAWNMLKLKTEKGQLNMLDMRILVYGHSRPHLIIERGENSRYPLDFTFISMKSELNLYKLRQACLIYFNENQNRHLI